MLSTDKVWQYYYDIMWHVKFDTLMLAHTAETQDDSLCGNCCKA
jgi:hypothetical protein